MPPRFPPELRIEAAEREGPSCSTRCLSHGRFGKPGGLEPCSTPRPIPSNPPRSTANRRPDDSVPYPSETSHACVPRHRRPARHGLRRGCIGRRERPRSRDGSGASCSPCSRRGRRFRGRRRRQGRRHGGDPEGDRRGGWPGRVPDRHLSADQARGHRPRSRRVHLARRRGDRAVVMDGPGPAFRFVGTHDGSAAPGDFKPDVWERQRMPRSSASRSSANIPRRAASRPTGRCN